MKLTNKDLKYLVIVLPLFFIVEYFYKGSCSILMQLYYNSTNRFVDQKFVYYKFNNQYYDALGISECSSIQPMNEYYNNELTSIDFEHSYVNKFTKVKVLKYDKSKSIAVIDDDNDFHKGRLNKDLHYYISIKCLHDGLPSDLDSNSVPFEVRKTWYSAKK